MASVELSYNELTLESLAEAIPDPTLIEAVDLSGNNISPEFAMSIIDKFIAKMPNLRSLDLKDNKIGPKGAIHLFEVLLQCCPKLVYLDVNENAIQDESMYALAVLLQNTKLTHLYVVTNHITPRGLPTLLDGVNANHTLVDLSLAFNILGDAGASIVESMLSAHPSLMTLDISDNHIGDTGAVAIANGFILSRNSRIESLNLSVNKIGDVGFQAISAALTRTHNPHFRFLDLGCNDLVGDIGRAALVQAAPLMRQVAAIDLTSCNLSDEEARALAAAIASPSSSLASIEWYNNPRMTLETENHLYEVIAAKERLLSETAHRRTQQITKALLIAAGVAATVGAVMIAAKRKRQS